MVDKFTEKRLFGRRTVFKPALIVLESGEQIAGVVVDISETGARFKTADPGRVPRTIVLQIPSDDFCVEGEVVHILSDAVGIKFSASPKRLSWLERTGPGRGILRRSRVASDDKSSIPSSKPALESQE